MQNRVLPRHLQILMALFFIAARFTTAQTCSPPSGGSFNSVNGWPSGSTVSVFIDTTNLNSTQVSAIQQAYANWQGVGGVQFSITTGTSNPGATYSVSGGSSLGTGVAGVTFTLGDPSSSQTIGASTSIATAETDFESVVHTMSHEIGHTFGLGEAPSATGGGSTMNEGDCPGTINEQSGCGSAGPTQADMASVDCKDTYTYNECGTPNDGNNPACVCDSEGDDDSCADQGLTCDSMNNVCMDPSTCDDVCDPVCDVYNVYCCDTYGSNGCDTPPSDDDDDDDGGGDDGGMCTTDGSDYCYDCWDYEDCNEDGKLIPATIIQSWIPTGVSFVCILPFALDVRRRRKIKDGDRA